MLRKKMDAKEEAEIKSCFSAADKLVNDEKLFAIFITAAQKNNLPIAGYILQECFSNAEDRANFGNKQDEKGNTAYHYAAQNNCKEIIVLLNNKRKFKGKQKFFQFNIENDEKQTPLDLCCLNGHHEVFAEIWHRAGKSNHNPARSLEYAYKGGSAVIIATLEKHPKVAKFLLQSRKRQRDDEEKESILQSSTARMLAKHKPVAKRAKPQKKDEALAQSVVASLADTVPTSPLSLSAEHKNSKAFFAVLSGAAEDTRSFSPR